MPLNSNTHIRTRTSGVAHKCSTVTLFTRIDRINMLRHIHVSIIIYAHTNPPASRMICDRSRVCCTCFTLSPVFVCARSSVVLVALWCFGANSFRWPSIKNKFMENAEALERNRTFEWNWQKKGNIFGCVWIMCFSVTVVSLPRCLVAPCPLPLLLLSIFISI